MIEYIRHGGCCLIANWEVAKGQVICPSLLPTRKECDFANHIASTIESEPESGWIFIVDQLNTHKSESLVRLVAACCEIETDLGLIQEEEVRRFEPKRRWRRNILCKLTIL